MKFFILLLNIFLSNASNDFLCRRESCVNEYLNLPLKLKLPKVRNVITPGIVDKEMPPYVQLHSGFDKENIGAFISQAINYNKLDNIKITDIRDYKQVIQKHLDTRYSYIETDTLGKIPFISLSQSHSTSHILIRLHGHEQNCLDLTNDNQTRNALLSGFNVVVPCYRAMEKTHLDHSISHFLYINNLHLMGIRVRETILILEHLNNKFKDSKFHFSCHSGGCTVGVLSQLINPIFQSAIIDFETDFLGGYSWQIHCEFIPKLRGYTNLIWEFFGMTLNLHRVSYNSYLKISDVISTGLKQDVLNNNLTIDFLRTYPDDLAQMKVIKNSHKINIDKEVQNRIMLRGEAINQAFMDAAYYQDAHLIAKEMCTLKSSVECLADLTWLYSQSELKITSKDEINLHQMFLELENPKLFKLQNQKVKCNQLKINLYKFLKWNVKFVDYVDSKILQNIAIQKSDCNFAELIDRNIGSFLINFPFSQIDFGLILDHLRQIQKTPALECIFRFWHQKINKKSLELGVFEQDRDAVIELIMNQCG